MGLQALFSIGFRPFFIMAGLIAALNPIIWVLTYMGHFEVPVINLSSLFWHSHEMLFGFTGALIAGFLLTASANWTGSKPYQGRPLVILVILWLIERLSYFFPLPEVVLLISLNLFFPAVLLMLFKKLQNFPKQKYVFIPMLFGFTISSFLHTWGSLYSEEAFADYGRDIAIGLIRFIILLIAGRVIPFFTRAKIPDVKIDIPNWLNLLSLGSVLLLSFFWDSMNPSVAYISILIIAITSNLFRQSLWRPLTTTSIPILFILHVGIGFINLELILRLVGVFYVRVNQTNAALHMLLAGGLAVVAIGIMTRVSLGHTGRNIIADSWTKVSYLFIIAGALVRSITPMIASQYYLVSLYFAVALWCSGFFIFVLKYFVILTSKRPDAKEY
ncbi:NnrS protein [Bacteriovorax sp. BAL6_X]|uniref:NnrS family protein n=1 Tax=Bacteriovorax sp. BAL6_X TaxID=1201290 RepID=UPI000385B577|nr:NnrS family protein [Bacteriovorax sp. BAL6_X]EPZ49276.1 NnrS protein [Bacteriovorax sp. BAL6_X]